MTVDLSFFTKWRLDPGGVLNFRGCFFYQNIDKDEFTVFYFLSSQVSMYIL